MYNQFKIASRLYFAGSVENPVTITLGTDVDVVADPPPAYLLQYTSSVHCCRHLYPPKVAAVVDLSVCFLLDFPVASLPA